MTKPGPDLRHEVKMTAPEAYLPRFLALLRLHPSAFSILHPPRWVNNVYLDSHDLSRLNQNYAGISDRAKVRFRWYGDLRTPARGSVEFKLKSSLLGWKRHFPVPRALELKQMTWEEFFGVLETELPPEGWLEIHNLNRPVLINRYHRRYYATPDRVIRITVDTDQAFLDQFGAARPNLSFPIPAPSVLVVEIKGPARAEDRIASILNGFPLLRSKNSKYVTGTERLTVLG